MRYQQGSGHRWAVAQFVLERWDRLNTVSRTLIYSRPLYRPDPLLGFGCNPGRHDLGIQLRSFAGLRSRTWSFTAMLDERGYRMTSSSSSMEPSRPEIWIYGCSYTWGWPLDNQDTFPFIVQTSLADFTIRNLAVNGYGTVHALLHLRHSLQNEESRPLVVVVAYNRFHQVRNVAAPSSLRRYRFIREQTGFSGLQYPRAELGRSAMLSVKLVPLRPSDEPDPTRSSMEAVTIAILDEIKRLCDRNAILPVLAVQSGDSFDKITQHCSDTGYDVIDMSLPQPLPEEYRLLPFDRHPNQAAHREYAAKLLTGLNSILDSRGLHDKSAQATP